MLRLIPLVLLFAAFAHSQAPEAPAEGDAKHETTENKKRTVPGGASKGIKACHFDIDRWCKAVKPGQGRIGACLQGHIKDISKSCRRWASHGGKEHVEEALIRDIDGAPVATSTPAPK